MPLPEMQQRASLNSSSTTAANSSPASNPQADPHVPFSIPPWVYVRDGSEKLSVPPHNEGILNAQSDRPPPPAHYRPGRKWDHQRTAEPPLLSAPLAEHTRRWEGFMQSGPRQYGSYDHRARVVNQAWLDEHMPYLSSAGWEDEEQEPLSFGARIGRGLMYQGTWLISPERQERTVRFIWRLLLKNPYVPLVFRLTILAFAAAALGVAARIFQDVSSVNNDPDSGNQCETRASTYMAICVGAAAIPYVAYITWDEYLSKPLGLRSVGAKISLLLCDLFFIVFSAANLSLAFDALYDDRWACFDEEYQRVGGLQVAIPSSCPNNAGICSQQKSLTAVLMVGTCVWLVTFSLSVLRVVEKLRPD